MLGVKVARDTANTVRQGRHWDGERPREETKNKGTVIALHTSENLLGL